MPKLPKAIKPKWTAKAIYLPDFFFSLGSVLARNSSTVCMGRSLGAVFVIQSGSRMQPPTMGVGDYHLWEEIPSVQRVTFIFPTAVEVLGVNHPRNGTAPRFR